MKNNIISHPRKEEIAAGIRRFYGEGYSNWSRPMLIKLLGGDLSRAEVELLKYWEKKGVIKLDLTNDCCMEVKEGFLNVLE